MHADDAVLIASTRSLAFLKLKHLLSYCKINSINLEATKSHFICVNGTDADRVPLPTTGGDIKNSSHIDLLGSHLSESGSVAADLQLHYDARFTTCIKFYNFLKTNKVAPLFIILNLESCLFGIIL